MRRWMIACSLILLSAAGASGQTQITGQQVGDFTFYSGSIAGETVSGSTQSIGAFDFTSFDDGSSYTTQHIGNFSFTTGRGISGTTQRIGSTSYFSAEEDQ